MTSIPYVHATSGVNARNKITTMLHDLGCDEVGIMDDFANRAVIVVFKYDGRHYQLKAYAAGWAAMYLKANPWRSGRHGTKADYEAKWLAQGQMAVNSMLRDWVKGQVTAIQTGLFQFHHAFLPHALTNDGQTVIERLESPGINLFLPPGRVDDMDE